MEENKPEIIRHKIKYVFLDVVKFSKKYAEAQSDIVRQLNKLTSQALDEHQITQDDCILIPTGDGMCIAFLLHNKIPYDIHIQTALTILRLLSGYDKETEDESRKFEIRIGIHENTDIIVNDINNRRNVAGAGINMTSRIMDKADGNQILVSQTVYEELQPSENYADKFKSYPATAKHGLKFQVFQYLEDCEGLNKDCPSEFAPKEIKPTEVVLSIANAYYPAHCIQQKDFIIENYEKSESLIILIWYLAKDSVGKSESTTLSPYEPEIYGNGRLALNKSLEY